MQPTLHNRFTSNIAKDGKKSGEREKLAIWLQETYLSPLSPLVNRLKKKSTLQLLKKLKWNNTPQTLLLIPKPTMSDVWKTQDKPLIILGNAKTIQNRGLISPAISNNKTANKQLLKKRCQISN